jgi:hypothetical protein
MNDNVANLILEKVNRIDERLSRVETDLSIVKESVRRIDGRLVAMDHYMAGFNAEQRWQNDELDHLKGRIERLEDQTPDSEK